MKYQLREYIDTLFRDAPPTKKTVEMKEEILQNLEDKYNDLIAEGKSEEAAYNIAVASVGDLSHLITELKGMPQQAQELTAEMQAYNKRKALFTSVAVAMYILSLIPMSFGWGRVLTLLLIAGATGLLIYINMSKPQYSKADETMAEEFREWRQQSNSNQQVYKSLSLALWMLTLVLYFAISFQWGHWHVTWLIFPLAGALNAVLKAVFDLKQGG